MGSLDLLEEAAADLPHSTRAMFGGHGLFAPNGGIFAAIVDEDRIVLKLADDAARGEMEALGGKAWTYNGKMTMRDWILVPDGFYDAPRTLAEWTRRAHRLAKPGKPKGKKAPAKKPAAKKAAKKGSGKARSRSPK